MGILVCVCIYLTGVGALSVCMCVREAKFLLSSALPPNSPCSWTWLWDTCMVDGAWEKALSTVRLPSARPEVGAYITACGLGYIMWPPTVVGTDDVMMVAGNVTGKHRHMSGRSHWSLLISPIPPPGAPSLQSPLNVSQVRSYTRLIPVLPVID